MDAAQVERQVAPVPLPGGCLLYTSTHGNADVRTGQNRGVIDAVAHKGEVLFGLLGGQKLLDLDVYKRQA